MDAEVQRISRENLDKVGGAEGEASERKRLLYNFFVYAIMFANHSIYGSTLLTVNFRREFALYEVDPQMEGHESSGLPFHSCSRIRTLFYGFDPLVFTWQVRAKPLEQFRQKADRLYGSTSPQGPLFAHEAGFGHAKISSSPPRLFPSTPQANVQSRRYTRIPPRTRLFLALGAVTWATLGLYGLGPFERVVGLAPNEKDQKELEKMLPKISVVDR